MFCDGQQSSIPGARFATVALDQRKGETIGWVVVRTPKPLSPEQVASLNDIINRTTGSSVILYVGSVITAETSREGYIYEPKLLPPDEQPRIPNETPQ